MDVEGRFVRVPVGKDCSQSRPIGSVGRGGCEIALLRRRAPGTLDKDCQRYHQACRAHQSDPVSLLNIVVPNSDFTQNFARCRYQRNWRNSRFAIV
jgi:hypothetical protein